MGIIESPIFWIVIAAASEIIALTPLKSNSVVQLVLQAVHAIKPSKKVQATFQKTVGGYLDITHVVRWNRCVAKYRQRNFIKLFLIKLIML